MPVFTERIDRSGTPFLFIGLGGTGADALRAVRQQFAQQFNLSSAREEGQVSFPRTGFLVIDSDASDKSGFAESEIVNISDSVNLDGLLKDPDHKNLSDQQKRWVHRDLHGACPDNGSGACRVASHTGQGGA